MITFYSFIDYTWIYLLVCCACDIRSRILDHTFITKWESFPIKLLKQKLLDLNFFSQRPYNPDT